MKKTLKKLIAIVLCLCLLSSMTVIFSGCGFLFGGSAKGTEGAKILLARERLDENLIGQKADVWSSLGFNLLSAPDSGITYSSLGSTNANTISRLSCDFTSDKVTWSEFGAYSDLKDSYTQFIDPIDNDAVEFAQTIATLKKDVGVTGKWVSVNALTGRKIMLVVTESSDIVIEIGDWGDVHVSIRYTDESGKNIYEMYSFMSYDDGTTGKIVNKCIPGERYEYMYQNSGGFNDYFIADKSLGYWTMNRFDLRDYGVFFDIGVVKDGLAYRGMATINNDGTTSVDDRYEFFLPNEERDAVSTTKYSHHGLLNSESSPMLITVHTSNILSGLDNIAVTGANNVSKVYSEEYGGSGIVHMVRSDNYIAGAQLSNGTYLAPLTKINDEIGFVEAEVSYSPEYHGDCYVGKLIFEVAADSFTEGYAKLLDYLGSQGVSLYTNPQTVLELYNYAQLMSEDFGDYTTFNGYKLNSIDNTAAAISVLEERYDEVYAIYDEYKDADSISLGTKISANETLTAITSKHMGSNSYANGVITSSGISLEIKDTSLLEEGMTYELRLGLALKLADGSISKVNVVPFEQSVSNPVEYTGKGSFGVSMTSEAYLTVPEYFSEGEYVVVAYIATADEGIRVTEMTSVAFYSADEGTIESDYMDVSVRLDGENLVLSYDIKLAEWTQSDIKKSTYTYEEIEKELLHGVLAKGYPADGATVQREDGTALSENESYGAGTYRLKFLTPTHDGFVEAYMYCSFGE